MKRKAATQTSPKRPLTFDSATKKALNEAARAQFRDVPGQIRKYVIEGLTRDGFLNSASAPPASE